MEYSISQISNRDLQIIYHYRILRQPSDFLKATYRDSEPVVLNFGPGVSANEYDEYGRKLYVFKASVKIPDNMIPFLEFSGDEDDWANIQDMIKISFEDDTANLYAAVDNLGKTTQITLFWCLSMQDIEKSLIDFKESLDKLCSDIDRLSKQMSNLDLSGDYVKRPSGVENHLIKYSQGEDDRITLDDSQHLIITGAAPKQTLTNPTTDLLSRITKTLGGTLTVHLNDGIERTLSHFRGDSIIIKGHGTVYLNNNRCSVILDNFSGTVYAQQCSYIQVASRTAITDFYAVDSIIEQVSGKVKNITLTRHSVFNQKAGSVKTLVHVGVGCVYHSEIIPRLGVTLEPQKVSYKVIEGTACFASGLIVIHGREVSFLTGHHDDPLPPTEIVASGTLNLD